MDGAVGQTGQDVGQILADGDIQFAAALDDAENGGDLWSRFFTSQVQPVLPTNRNRPHRVLRPVGR